MCISEAIQRKSPTYNINELESPLPLTDWRDAEAQYSVSHHMVIKLFLLLGLAAEYRSQQWV